MERVYQNENQVFQIFIQIWVNIFSRSIVWRSVVEPFNAAQNVKFLKQTAMLKSFDQKH